MGYVEERIKFLAVEAWQNNKKLHELTCANEDCEGKRWGGTLRADWRPTEEAKIAVILCHDCGHVQEFVPDVVIDAFLDRV